MEPSLLAVLVFEEKDKIRMNVLNTLVNLIDNLPVKQWLQGLDIEKAEKQ